MTIPYHDPENEREARLEAAYANRDAPLVNYDDESDRDVGKLLAEWRRLNEAGVKAEIDWVNGVVVRSGSTKLTTSDGQPNMNDLPSPPLEGIDSDDNIRAAYQAETEAMAFLQPPLTRHLAERIVTLLIDAPSSQVSDAVKVRLLKFDRRLWSTKEAYDLLAELNELPLNELSDFARATCNVRDFYKRPDEDEYQ